MARFTSFAVFVFLLSCAAPASGQLSYPAVPIDSPKQSALGADWRAKYGQFDQKDLNQDGGVDFEEHRRSEWLFRLQYDFDGNGQLSWPEFVVGICSIPSDPNIKSILVEGCLRHSRRDFDRLEKSGDGVLSYEESVPLAKSSFATLNRCKDGKYRPVCS